MILSFNLQWLVIPKVNFFQKKIVLGRLIKILQATSSEHTLHDELVGAEDKDKGLLSVQSAVFFIFICRLLICMKNKNDSKK